MRFMKKIIGLLVPAAFAGVAAADPVAITTTDAITQIGNGQTAVLAVGAAVLVLALVVAGFRWVRRAAR